MRQRGSDYTQCESTVLTAASLEATRLVLPVSVPVAVPVPEPVPRTSVAVFPRPSASTPVAPSSASSSASTAAVVAASELTTRVRILVEVPVLQLARHSTLQITAELCNWRRICHNTQKPCKTGYVSISISIYL